MFTKLFNSIKESYYKLMAFVLPAVATVSTTVINCSNVWESDEAIKQGAINFIDLIAPVTIVLAIAAAIFFFFWGLFSSKDATQKFKLAGISIAVAVAFGIGGTFIYGSFSAIFDVFRNAA